MANKIINKVFRLSDLPELKKAVGKTIVAFNRENYAIDVSLIRGKKINDIKEVVEKDPTKPKKFIIEFSDGTAVVLRAYNGTDGDKGRTGYDGEKGDPGISIDIDPRTGADKQFSIVNNINILESEEDEEHDDLCRKGWSAYRGKAAYLELEQLNETFLTEEEYEVLFNEEEILYIEAEYKSNQDDQLVLIFNNDTNPHIKYHKYWTYEDSTLATYYIYNPVSNSYDEVVADLWEDIYLGATSGYFLVTTNQMQDGTTLYVYDPFYTNERGDNYKPITVVDEANQVDGVYHVEHYFDCDLYDEDLDKYIKVHYDYLGSSYKYSLKADSELPKPVYKYKETIQSYELVSNSSIDKENPEEDYYKIVDNSYELILDIKAYLEEDSSAEVYRLVETPTYELVPDNSVIDANIPGMYFILKADGTYEELSNVLAYLDTNDERYFVIDTNGNIKEVSSVDKVDTDNYQEYLKVTIDRINDTYTFHRWYPVTKYEDTFYVEVEKTYGKNGIDIYAYTDDRTYYTSEYVTTENPDGSSTFETVYHPILIPMWIDAEYTTTYEDENTLILNSVYEEPGEEDNSEIDTTSEDYEEDEEITPVQFMVAGGVPKIYTKEDEFYLETSIEEAMDEDMIFYGNNGLVINKQYYIKSDSYSYVPIKGSNVESHYILYYKVDNTYKIFKGDVIDPDATYYLREEKYDLLRPSTFYEHTITLFAGVPQQLAISFFPQNANNKKAIIDYDADVIELYEGGRIASMEENGETDIYITPETGQGLHIHVILTTPMSSIDITSEGYGIIGENPIVVGDTTTLKALVRPLKTSNKNIDFELSNNCISFGTPVINDNDVTTVLTAVSQGTTTIYLDANDGYGAKTDTSVEVVNPVTNTNWTNISNPGPNDIHWVENTYFTQLEANEYNNENGYHFGDEGFVIAGDLKEAAHFEMTILKGLEYELKIDNIPSDSSRLNITWNVDPTNVATVSRKTVDVIEQRYATQEDVDNNLATEVGELITIKTGTRSFYSIKGNITGECYVNGVNTFNSDYFDANDDHVKNTNINLKVVVIQSVESIDIIPSSLSFNIGEKKQLTAVVNPETADNRSYSWETSNPSIVNITENGVVTGLAPGTAFIYARSKDGSNVYGACPMTINIPLSGISFENGLIYVGLNSTSTVTATIMFNTNYELNNPQINWSSADPSIATVSGNNKTAVITGKKLGSTTIIATDKNNSGAMGTIQIAVIKYVNSINFNNYTDLALNINDMVILMPEFDPVDSSIQVLEYTSSDTTIAKVTNEGIVTALAEGTVTITARATDGGPSEPATCTITITK